jgi:hypothetical protein
VVDNEELHDLLLFISVDLTNKDIPHCSMLTKLIVENFQREYVKLQEEIQVSSNLLIFNSSLTYFFKNSAGQVSYTSDVWSRNDLSAFMAVTAHYLVMNDGGNLDQRNCLVAFRHLHGSYTGENLADVFFQVLEELSVFWIVYAFSAF